MPAGSNIPNEHIYDSGGVLPCIISTGGGDTQNETGYDIEFFSNDPITSEAEPDEQDLSSFSNGYIAGQLTAIINTLNCSIWEARYRAQVTADRNEVGRVSSFWEPLNGYGKINVNAAIAYVGLIPPDPYLPMFDEAAYLATIAQLEEDNTMLRSLNDQLVIDIATLPAENAQLVIDNAALQAANTLLVGYQSRYNQLLLSIAKRNPIAEGHQNLLTIINTFN